MCVHKTEQANTSQTGSGYITQAYQAPDEWAKVIVIWRKPRTPHRSWACSFPGWAKFRWYDSERGSSMQWTARIWSCQMRFHWNVSILQLHSNPGLSLISFSTRQMSNVFVCVCFDNQYIINTNSNTYTHTQVTTLTIISVDAWYF